MKLLYTDYHNYMQYEVKEFFKIFIAYSVKHSKYQTHFSRPVKAVNFFNQMRFTCNIKSVLDHSVCRMMLFLE